MHAQGELRLGGGGRRAGDRAPVRRPRPVRSPARGCAAGRARRARARACRAAGRGRGRAARCARARPRGGGWRARPPPARGCSRPAARAAAGAGGRGGGRRGGRARARAGPACARGRRSRGRSGAPAGRPGARSAARAAAQSTATAASAACVGVEQATAATSSISVWSVWWPTEEMTGTRSIATVRHSVSSQNANRSASEPPPRATTITSTGSQAARSCRARVIAGAAWRSWTGANAQTTRPAQPRRRSPASTSSRALPPSPVTTPIVRGSAGRGRRFCGSVRPSACSARRSRSTWASRSPSPASRSPVTAKENCGEDVREPA